MEYGEWVRRGARGVEEGSVEMRGWRRRRKCKMWRWNWKKSDGDDVKEEEGEEEATRESLNYLWVDLGHGLGLLILPHNSPL